MKKQGKRRACMASRGKPAAAAMAALQGRRGHGVVFATEFLFNRLHLCGTRRFLPVLASMKRGMPEIFGDIP